MGKQFWLQDIQDLKVVWMCKVLLELEANVIGYAQKPITTPNLYELSEIEKDIVSYIGDVQHLSSRLSR